jgi:Immunity protein 21
MDEVESAGGPLMCVESGLADQWRGVDGLSFMPVATTGVETDYDYACRMPNQYLSIIPLMRGRALLLAGMPLITGVWKNSLNQVIIWRISYAEPDDDIPELLASLGEGSFETPVGSVEFSFGSPKVVIFDAGLPGGEAQSESVSFDIETGRYLVTTHVVRPAPSAELWLHRFNAIS